MAVVGAKARMRPERAQRSGSIGRTLAAATVMRDRLLLLAPSQSRVFLARSDHRAGILGVDHLVIDGARAGGSGKHGGTPDRRRSRCPSTVDFRKSHPPI